MRTIHERALPFRSSQRISPAVVTPLTYYNILSTTEVTGWVGLRAALVDKGLQARDVRLGPKDHRLGEQPAVNQRGRV